MMLLRSFLLLAVAVVAAVATGSAGAPDFEYHSGDAGAMQSAIRLTSDKQSQKGAIWNLLPNTYVHWEAVIKFKIHGKNANVGADGFAFWYTRESDTSGDLFGNTQRFYGMGIIVDTFDNDGSGLHPYIMLAFNDGEKDFSHYHGAGPQGTRNGLELGGCSATLRNVGESTLRIVYDTDYTVKVFIKAYESAEEKLCVEADNLDIPANYHFGFTAATGDLADNHDIVGMTVRNLKDDGQREDEHAPEDSLMRAVTKMNYESGLIREAIYRVSSRVSDLYEDFRTQSNYGASVQGDGNDGDNSISRVVEQNEVIARSVRELSNKQVKVENTLNSIKHEVVQNRKLLEEILDSGVGGGGSFFGNIFFWICLVGALVLGGREMQKRMDKRPKTF